MRISPCIWLDDNAEEAANFYVSVFPNSSIKKVERYITLTPSNKPIGSVMYVIFEIDGNEFMTLNGGSDFKVSEAVSFIIPCKDQSEINQYYDKLSADPDAEYCGWIKDKFGVSWQLIPEDYEQFMNTLDDEKKIKVIEVLMNMRKLDVDLLRQIAIE